MEGNTSKKNINITERIVSVLNERPGLKAREIANVLNVDKKIINSALYGMSVSGREF